MRYRIVLSYRQRASTLPCLVVRSCFVLSVGWVHRSELVFVLFLSQQRGKPVRVDVEWVGAYIGEYACARAHARARSLGLWGQIECQRLEIYVCYATNVLLGGKGRGIDVLFSQAMHKPGRQLRGAPSLLAVIDRSTH